MMKIIKIKILFLLILSGLCHFPQLSAQQKNEKKGHRLVFHIKEAKDEIVYLTIHHQDKLYLRDSARVSKPGIYIFEGDSKYEGGLYTLLSQDRYPYLNLILDQNFHFEYFLDTTGNTLNFSVKNSPENSEMLAFQQKTQIAQKEFREVINKKKQFENENIKDSLAFYTEKQTSINDDVLHFINQLIAKNPDFLFSKMQKAFQPIEIPDPPVKADGTIDSTFQYTYYLTHYWDNVDLTDSRFIYLPVLEELYQGYFKKALFHQPTDTICKYIDHFLSKTESDTLMFKYMVNRLAHDFESSKVPGHDGVFIHIVRNYHLKGKCPWLNEETLTKFRKREKVLGPLLIGQPAPELIIPDTSGKIWISSHQLKDKYVVLWFFDPTCQTCKRESAKMKVIYDSLSAAGTRNFEIYAIGNDSDTERWKRYVRDNGYQWINVGGHTGNIDYLNVYNIYETGNPTMFILNEKREIILNRSIDANDIPLFLMQYEAMMKKR